eukprot:gb/GECG01009934.1/.p1 GENE.gb/GECG01009934.1/~~gb/GECG01009934.1/.p1  ORF type:complete len:272 (+),score=10.92 gb/GECG01009934.1/:1-816(+)
MWSILWPKRSTFYSTGRMRGIRSGGLVGIISAQSGGVVEVSSSFSTGTIDGYRSGGIVGVDAGFNGGTVRISDSYSTGAIAGQKAGGISGEGAGKDGGSVYVNRTYASGNIIAQHGGGIIGGIYNGTDADFSDPPRDIVIQFSVHSFPGPMVGHRRSVEPNVLGTKGNSADLADIRGQLYHQDGRQKWSEDEWAIVHPNELPVLKFQLPIPSVTPSPTQSCRPLRTSSPTTTRMPTTPPSATQSPNSGLEANKFIAEVTVQSGDRSVFDAG